MAEEDSGSKTEPPTAKKLKEARKKGDVPKIPDIGLTLGFLFALLIIWLLSSTIATRFTELLEASFVTPGKPFLDNMKALGLESIRVLIELSLLVMLPIAFFSTFVEYLVTGPVLTSEKLKLNMSHLNPAAGLKRMFGADNFVELLKSVAKTVVLITITLIVVRSALGELALLPYARPDDMVASMLFLVIRVFGWASAVFVLLMFLDALYQQYSFTKRMRMSMRDIRDELKASEGDPMLRGERKHLGQEWAQDTPANAARGADVLVVNPTHVAIAIRYEPEVSPVPRIAGRGEEKVAREMREAAAMGGVPVIRNVKLARALLVSDVDADQHVPRELFNVVAEVIIWAQRVREIMARAEEERANGASALVVDPAGRPTEGLRAGALAARSAPAAAKLRAPGEDLTDYTREARPEPV